MRWLIVISICWSFAGFSQESFDGCLEAGVETGQVNTTQFCNALIEQEQCEERVTRAYSYVPVQFCSLAIADSCRRSMWRSLEETSWCYHKVLNEAEHYENFLQVVNRGCPMPTIMACPFAGARVHKGFWCRPPSRNQYWAYIDGLWWRFVRNDGGFGDSKRYLVQATDGAMRVVTRHELTVVTPR